MKRTKEIVSARSEIKNNKLNGKYAKVSQINASLMKKSNLGLCERERRKPTSQYLCMNVNGRKQINVNGRK